MNEPAVRERDGRNVTLNARGNHFSSVQLAAGIHVS